jgi:hypothetical protein
MIDIFRRSLELGDLVLITSYKNNTSFGVFLNPTKSQLRVFNCNYSSYSLMRSPTEDSDIIDILKKQLDIFEQVRTGTLKASYFGPKVSSHAYSSICKLNIKYPNLDELKNKIGLP